MPAHAIQKISVVIPCYYSERMISKVVTMTRDVLVENNYDYEFVLVNDGSTDGTFKEIEKLAAADERIVGLDCSRNLGQHSAIMAGLHYAHGDAIMLMDDDMQTHPNQCMKLIRAFEETGDDVVFARWEEHKEALWRRIGSGFSSWTMQVMTKRSKSIDATNFFIMSDTVCREVLRYTGPYIYIQGLICRSTSRISNTEVEHFEREEGSSGYTFSALVKLWSTILNFSMMPLRATSIIGSAFGLVGLCSGVAVVIQKLVLDPSIDAGWPSLMATVLFCSGIILLSLGLIGEYLGRVFMTLNNSPQFVIRTVVDRREGAPSDIRLP